MSQSDLHIHTKASDGGFTPEEILTESVKRGLKIIAITDHNTVEGSRQAVRNNLSSIRIIPGVELETFDPKRNCKIEILAYNIDFDSKELFSMIKFLNEETLRRNHLKIKQLQERGVKINYDLVKKYSRGNDVSSYAFVNALKSTNYKELVNSQEELDPEKFLRNSFKLEKQTIHPKDAIKVIANAGGVSIIAHAYDSLKHHPEEVYSLITEYKTYGLDGIEVYHPKHKPEQIIKLKAIARKLGLLVTGGSDFHAKDYGGNLGEGIVDEDLSILSQFKS